MPEVNVLELEKEAKAKKAAESTINSRKIGDITVFKGKHLDKEYTDYGECVQENQKEAKRKANLAAGLNEDGLSPEQVERQEKIKALLGKRKKAEDVLRGIDIEISNVRRGERAEVQEEPKAEEKKNAGRKPKA